MLIDHEFQTYSSFLKYLIFTVNFIIWLLGGFLFVFGVYIKIDGLLWEYTEALDITRYNWACYIVMFVGLILIVISFLGCLGAATESPFLLLFYISITGFCMILEIVATILVWKIAGGDELQAVLSKDIERHIDRMTYDADSTRFLEIIQLKLSCCGAYTHLDYDKKKLTKPPTCNSNRTNNIQIRSCGEMLRRYLEIRGGLIGGACLALLLMQTFILAFLFCLIWIMKETRNDIPEYSKG